ncbi:MAG: glycosyltransferase [Myxococcales bacterium]|nr:MAG: glycosyltransferase [Myxococcales bacterium]
MQLDQPAGELCSVVIPTHNRAKLVARAIRSVQAQTYTAWELIVVDDASTDDTAQAVEPLLSERIRYLRQPRNAGAAAARNAGARAARGRYITFLDSDDEGLPTWLEQLMGMVTSTGVALVCCGLSEFEPDGRHRLTRIPTDMGALFDHTVAQLTHGSDYLVEKRVFDAVGGFDELLRSGQHTELALRLLPYLREQGLRVANVFEPLITVHIHRGARIRTDWEAMFQGHSRAVEKHRLLFEKDRRMLSNYLSIAAVCGVRTRRYGEARKLFKEAAFAHPQRPVLWARLAASRLPLIPRLLWRA